MNDILSIGRGVCEHALPNSFQEICLSEENQKVTLAVVAALFFVAYKGSTAIEKRRHFSMLSNCDPIQAAKNGHLNAMRAYIKSGKDLEVKDNKNNTLMMLAIENGHYTIVKELIEKGARLDALNTDGKNSFQIAAESRNPNVIDLILEKIPDINAVSLDGDTPLIAAAKRGSVATVERLVRMDGINLNLKNGDEMSALHYAAQEHPEIVDILCESGADPDLVGKNGKTPLHFAVDQDCADAIPILLKYSKDPNAKNRDQETPLIAAAGDFHGRLNSIKKLVEDNRVDPNLLNEDGESALHLAIYGMAGNDDLALALIEMDKFDLTLQSEADGTKETPLDQAKRLNKQAIVRAIEAKIGDSPSETRKTPLPDGDGFVEDMEKEKLEALQKDGFSLIDYAILHSRTDLQVALQKKGIYFELTEVNRPALSIEMLKKYQSYVVKFLELCPLKIVEFGEWAESYKAFVENPTWNEIPEIMEFALLSVENRLQFASIRSKHQKNGTGIVGKLTTRFEELKSPSFSPFPPEIQAQIDRILGMDRDDFLNQLELDESAKKFLSIPRTLSELVEFWPVYEKLIKKDNGV